MPKYFIPAFALAIVLTGAGCAAPVEDVVEETVMMEALELVDGQYALNADQMVTWDGGKVVGGDHNGTVNASEGLLVVSEGMISEGTVVIDMTTVVSLDLEGAGKASLEEHLMSEDFFAADTNPTATFAITEAEMLEGIEGSNYRLDGVMTIRGVEQSLSFPAMVSAEEGSVSLSAELELDRTLWDVNYGSGSIFDDLGDAVIKDEFTLGIELNFSADEVEAMEEDVAEEESEEVEAMEEEGEEEGTEEAVEEEGTEE